MSVMIKGNLARVGFWAVVTIIFLYDRKYLIEKAGLPHFIECAVVRIGLLIALATFNLAYLIPTFFERKAYFLYGLLLTVTVGMYVSIQQSYDIYLYNYVLGASIPRTFAGSFTYTFITTCWYLALTVAFHLSLGWFEQKIALKKLIAENAFLRANGPARVEAQFTGNPGEKRESLKLKTGTSGADLDINDILYIQGLKDYSVIHTVTGKTVVYGNLKTIERQLPGNGFERVHKSYLVPTNKITRRERSRLWINTTEIPVGRTFQKSIYEKK